MILFFFNNTATTEIYTLSLHDALPILLSAGRHASVRSSAPSSPSARRRATWEPVFVCWRRIDRKSTRLNSSHVAISYAVFCLKKKKRIRDLQVVFPSERYSQRHCWNAY